MHCVFLQDNSEVHFKIKKTTQLKKLKQAYADRQVSSGLTIWVTKGPVLSYLFIYFLFLFLGSSFKFSSFFIWWPKNSRWYVTKTGIYFFSLLCMSAKEQMQTKMCFQKFGQNSLYKLTTPRQHFFIIMICCDKYSLGWCHKWKLRRTNISVIWHKKCSGKKGK